MSARVTLVILALTAGCGCGGADVVDAGPDSPDAPVADRRELYEFVLEPGTVEDCGEWRVPPHPTTRLALSPPGTATVLWEWSAVEEPALSDWTQWSPHRLSSLALGPDGTIWAMGPDGTAIVTIGHDGRMRGVTRLIETFRPSSLGGFPIRPLPDGMALYEPEPGWMVRLHPTGGYLTVWDNRGSTRGNSFVAVGPGRRVYISERSEDGPSWLVASCNGDRDRYVWRLQVRTPWNPEGRSIGGRVLIDGTILGFREDAFVRITPDGEVMWLSEPSVYRPGFVTVAHELAAGTQLVETGSIGTGYRLRALTVSTGVESWSTRLPQPSSPSVTWRMDALGHIALLTYDGTNNTFEVVDPNGTVLWTRDYFDRNDFGAFTDGGGWIGGRGSAADGAALARMGADGDYSWQLTVGLPGDGGGNGVLDVDGRYYAIIVGGVAGPMWGAVPRLVAIQTDALPPRGDVCLNSEGSYECNAHHSNWTALYQPVPPSE